MESRAQPAGRLIEMDSGEFISGLSHIRREMLRLVPLPTLRHSILTPRGWTGCLNVTVSLPSVREKLFPLPFSGRPNIPEEAIFSPGSPISSPRALTPFGWIRDVRPVFQP